MFSISNMLLQDYSKRNYNCQCGESFSSLEELNEHTDLIIQYFI
jgi:hypothetical protein